MSMTLCGSRRFCDMRYSAPVVTVQPTWEPVDVDSLRTHSRIDFPDEDDVLRDYLRAARRQVEVDTQRALCTQTLAIKMDGFPCDQIEMRVCPVQSVTSVVYLDGTGASQTLSSSVYVVDIYSEPATITLAYGQVWPMTYDQTNAVTVTFVAGYGSAAQVEPMACQAIRMLAGHWAQNREAVGASMSETPLGYSELIERLRWAGYR